MIGLGGEINAGKDTLAMYLQAKYSYVPRGFADPLYEQLAVLDPLIWDHETLRHRFYSVLVKEYGVDVAKRKFPGIRTHLRRLGNECGRDIHGEDCWIRVLDSRARSDARTVTKDIRFLNEVYYTQDRGGLLINVVSDRSVPLEPSVCPSERLNFAKYADYTVDNSGTREESYEQLEDILDTYNQVSWKIDV